MMIPYVSVIVGGIAAYALGVIWYMVLANPWMKAAKLTREDISASSANGINTSMIITYGVTFLLWLAASFILQAHLRSSSLLDQLRSEAEWGFGFGFPHTPK